MGFLQLKMELEEIEPKIWRRFIVGDSINFHKLHETVQTIMGWKNYHLYEFDINNTKIGLIDEDTEYDIKDSKKIKLSGYLLGLKQNFNYLYDFGDGWECNLVVEKILDNLPEHVGEVPFCLGGERAGPHEDCGGIGGYERFLEIFETGKDPWGEDVKELKEWVGDWKPENFNITKINKELK